MKRLDERAVRALRRAVQLGDAALATLADTPLMEVPELARLVKRIEEIRQQEATLKASRRALIAELTKLGIEVGHTWAVALIGSQLLDLIYGPRTRRGEA